MKTSLIVNSMQPIGGLFVNLPLYFKDFQSGFSVASSVCILWCGGSPNPHRTFTDSALLMRGRKFVGSRPRLNRWCFLTAGFTKYSSPIELIPGSKVRRYPIAQCPTEGDLQLRQELVHALQAKRAWNLSSCYWFMLGFPIHWVLEIVRIESPFNKWWLYVSRKALADDNKWPKRNHHNI